MGLLFGRPDIELGDGPDEASVLTDSDGNRGPGEVILLTSIN